MYVVLSTRRVDNTVRLSNPATFPVDYARYIVYASFGKKKRASGRDQGRNVCDAVVRSRQRHGGRAEPEDLLAGSKRRSFRGISRPMARLYATRRIV